MHDLVIRGGTLVDGSGGPARLADVAVDGSVITAVGGAGEVGPGRREIDADGAVVTPGFVDIHTHYDAQATWDGDLTPSGWHGVTTVMMGNCGVGFAPAAPDRRDWLIQLMEGVEDIPGAALTDGIEWEWESFPEYLDALARRSWVCDVATQVPHSALRAYVMGERGAADDAATDADLAEMVRLSAEALSAGALGISTSRTPLHKARDGEFVPGTTVAADELIALAEATTRVGHGSFQMALHHPELPGQYGWLRRLAEVSAGPVTFNLQQTDDAPDLWRTNLEFLDRAAADGLDLWGQVAGRPIGILFSWEGTAHPFLLSAAYQPYAAMDPAERLAHLRRPEVRTAICGDRVEGLDGFLESLIHGYDKMWPFTGETSYEPDPAGSVAAIAARSGASPTEVVYDALMADDGRGLLYFPIFNYADRDLDFLRELHLHPRTRMGLADAGAHCGAICDGSTPSFMLQFWCRDRERGQQLPLTHVVARQTRQTALHVGLEDRGLVAPGLRADLNVIDLDALTVDRPSMAHDLPTGARRYVQAATGYLATVTAGSVVRANDEFTGERPGRLVRGPRGRGGSAGP